MCCDFILSPVLSILKWMYNFMLNLFCCNCCDNCCCNICRRSSSFVPRPTNPNYTKGKRYNEEDDDGIDADSDYSEEEEDDPFDSMDEMDDDDLDNENKSKSYKKRRMERRSRTLSEDIQMHVQTGHFKPFHFLALVCIAVVALFITFGPIIASDVHGVWIESGHLNTTTIITSSQHQLTQIFSRLFPWGRGLCHAYWAPNVWSWYVTGDRVARRAIKVLKIPMFQNISDTSSGMTGGLVQITSMSVLPNIQPVVTFALTFLFIVPVLWKVSCLILDFLFFECNQTRKF